MKRIVVALLIAVSLTLVLGSVALAKGTSKDRGNTSCAVQPSDVLTLADSETDAINCDDIGIHPPPGRSR